MENDDTIKMLNECNSGIKMAVTSIDEVLPKVKSEQFKQILNSSKQEHERLGDETHHILNHYDDNGKEPSPVAKSMSWVKTNIKMTVDPTDNAAADLITDGCNMGVKSLSKYLNEYQAANEQAKSITQQLIQSEEELAVNMRAFL